ncbi:MAG: transcription termination/antitermination protein NusG [Elusimicrobia bacterium]|nr:transcription termination/antitermination protein NusG [Elusimicrobiota bacterium]
MEQKSWYIVHTQTGYEDRVRKSIESRAELQGFKDRVFEVLIPTEEVVEVKQNKKVVRKRKFFPGYILVNLILTSEVYWFIKSTPGVSGFLGDPKPAPLDESEVVAITELTTASAQGKPKPAVQFERGESVRITEGPFKHFMGVVEEVHEAKSKVKVMVTVFDRPTPVELDFLQVEKM